MEYRVEINKRLVAAFPSMGIAGYSVGLNSNIYDLRDEENEGYGKSKFGTPFWDQIKVRASPSGEDELTYTFENDPIVDAYLRKKATETEVFDGKSVIESTGVMSAEFRIRGVLWDNTGKYPTEQLRDLLEIFREAGELEVVSSRFFSEIGILNLHINSISLPGIEGFHDSQPFIITCSEVPDVNLEIYDLSNG